VAGLVAGGEDVVVTGRFNRLIRAPTRGGNRKYWRYGLSSALAPVELTERDTLRSFFLPERPGPQTALQALGETT
jgi:hypothetical protein